LLGLLFILEGGSNMFLQKVGIFITMAVRKVKRKAIPVTGREGP
jgi:hypothetical protein